MASHDNYDKNILKALQDIDKSLRSIADSLSRVTGKTEEKNNEIIKCGDCLYYRLDIESAQCMRDSSRINYVKPSDGCSKGVKMCSVRMNEPEFTDGCEKGVKKDD